MVTLNDAFPSKYLKATDLAEPVIATIKLAELERIKGFDGKEQPKVVLYFAKKLKPLPLNRTNFESVMDISGSSDSEDCTPRIAFLSAVRGSGKTRALEISALLVPRPLLVVNVSAAYLFRRVADSYGLPTVLYDECDTVFSKNADLSMKDVCGLLNAGHRKGAVSGRCVNQGKNIEPEDFPAYCAVALAGLGRWLPDTILSRSVVVRMRRRAPNESVEPYRPRLHDESGHALRDRLAAWAAGIERRIEMPELPKEIQDRDADVWEPLIAVADAAGGEWPDRARCSAVALVALLQRGWGVADLSLQLLSDLRTIFGDHQLLPTKDILSLLIELPESAWAGYRGKLLTDGGLVCTPFDRTGSWLR